MAAQERRGATAEPHERADFVAAHRLAVIIDIRGRVEAAQLVHHLESAECRQFRTAVGDNVFWLVVLVVEEVVAVRGDFRRVLLG